MAAPRGRAPEGRGRGAPGSARPLAEGPLRSSRGVLRGRSGSLVPSCWEAAAAATPEPPELGIGQEIGRPGGKAVVHLEERIRFRCHSLYS